MVNRVYLHWCNGILTPRTFSRNEHGTSSKHLCILKHEIQDTSKRIITAQTLYSKCDINALRDALSKSRVDMSKDLAHLGLDPNIRGLSEMAYHVRDQVLLICERQAVPLHVCVSRLARFNLDWIWEVRTKILGPSKSISLGTLTYSTAPPTQMVWLSSL